MANDIDFTAQRRKCKKKQRAGSKSPDTPRKGKPTPTPESTRMQRMKRSESLKAIAAAKPHGGGVGSRPANAVALKNKRLGDPKRARARKEPSMSPKATSVSALPSAPAASTAVSTRHDEARLLRSFGSAAEAVAEVPKLGMRLGAIRAQYRDALHSVLACLYTCACYFRENDDAWVLFCLDPFWNDATVKPRRDKLGDILKFVIRRAVVGPRKQVNDRVHKYTRALLPSWEARRTPDEVLSLLKKLGIAKAAQGLPMKEVAEMPGADSTEEVDQEISPPDPEDGGASKAADKKVLEGEVLTNEQSQFKRRFRLRARWPEGNFEGSAKVARSADGKRRLVVKLRQVI